MLDNPLAFFQVNCLLFVQPQSGQQEQKGQGEQQEQKGQEEQEVLKGQEEQEVLKGLEALLTFQSLLVDLLQQPMHVLMQN